MCVSIPNIYVNFFFFFLSFLSLLLKIQQISSIITNSILYFTRVFFFFFFKEPALILKNLFRALCFQYFFLKNKGTGAQYKRNFSPKLTDETNMAYKIKTKNTRPAGK